MKLRQQESEQLREDLVIHYQDRINSITNNRDAAIDLFNDRFQEQFNMIEEMVRRVEDLQKRDREPSAGRNSSVIPGEDCFNGQVQENIGNGPGRFHQNNGRGYDIPFPRQLIYDGKLSWDGFIKPFESLAQSCGWSDDDKLFRLVSSLRGEASEYAFNQLTAQTLQSYESLKYALEVRFKERRTSSSYLNELEGRKYSPKEKLSEYAADIKRLVIKGYPTADERTRETISVRHFLKGFYDQQMAVAVGMREPGTVNEAREMVETYNSLKMMLLNTKK